MTTVWLLREMVAINYCTISINSAHLCDRDIFNHFGTPTQGCHDLWQVENFRQNLHFLPLISQFWSTFWTDRFDTALCDPWHSSNFDTAQVAVTRDCRIDRNSTVQAAARVKAIIVMVSTWVTRWDRSQHPVGQTTSRDNFLLFGLWISKTKSWEFEWHLKGPNFGKITSGLTL